MPATKRKTAKTAKKTVEAEEPSSPDTASEAEDIIDSVLDDMGDVGKRLRRLGDPGLSIHIPGVIPSGSAWLDNSLGRGGWPLSRIALLTGKEGSGKTTLALQLCANVQKAGGIAVYIDAEYKLDVGYAAALGVDINRLLIEQPNSMEESIEVTLEMAEKFAARRTNSKRVIPLAFVYDSLNAFMTEAEIEGKENPGVAARVMGSGLRRINQVVSKTSAFLLQISQVREKIGVTHGSNKTTACGRGPRFYATIIADIEPKQAIKNKKGEKIGTISTIEITKNQVAPPFRKCEVAITYGKGIDWVDSVHQALIAADLVEAGKSGWTAHTELGLRWQGASGLQEIANDSPEDFGRLVGLLDAKYGWGA